MGSPISPVIADLFMEDFEDKVFKSYDRPPRVWERFVDDVIAVIHEEGSELLNYLSQPHPTIKVYNGRGGEWFSTLYGHLFLKTK